MLVMFLAYSCYIRQHPDEDLELHQPLLFDLGGSVHRTEGRARGGSLKVESRLKQRGIPVCGSVICDKEGDWGQMPCLRQLRLL